MADTSKNPKNESIPEPAKDIQLPEGERSLPVLPVRDTVLFPHAVLPLTVGRDSSVQLINQLGEEKSIVVVAQREARVDTPQPTDLYSIGTLATVHKVVKMPNQSLFVFTEGVERVHVRDYEQLTPFMRATVETISESKIDTEVQDQVQQSQREYYLREQMKAIQKELGEQDETQRDTEDLKKKIEAAGMPEEVKKEALKELTRLGRMSPMAADYSLTRSYIEWLAVLPWSKSSGTDVDITKAKEILDEDHYDLQKVKDRILDYLSVRR